MQNENANLTVPGLLNIFYRGRGIVVALTLVGLIGGIAYGIIVKPLYRATAQVRPGVVSYNPDGFPNREWALEDVVNWFDGFLYWKDLRQAPGFAGMKNPPVIDATFIPSLNFVAGGNVITLTNLARSPELAVETLDEAVRVFNRQAMADSMGSSLHLTLRKGRAMMRRLQRDIELVDAKAERIDLDIAQQQREMSMIDLQVKELDLELQARAADIVWMTEAVANSRQDVESARARLADAEAMLKVALSGEKNPVSGGTPVGGGDPVSEVLKQSATREQAGRVGELLMTVNDLAAFINTRSVRADSLEARIKATELEMGRIRLVQEIDVAKQRADVEQKIRDLNISLERDLPHERDVLRSDLETERVKVELISPLERVGTTSVTDKPVRPRKLRAVVILTFLAFVGSLFVVLALEYVRNNRAAITAARHSN